MRNTMHKRSPEICTGCRVSAAKIHLYHSTEIAKARSHSVEILKNYENLQNRNFLKTL